MISRIRQLLRTQAVDYYRKLGWTPEAWDETELVGIASGCLQMSKRLT